MRTKNTVLWMQVFFGLFVFVFIMAVAFYLIFFFIPYFWVEWIRSRWQVEWQTQWGNLWNDWTGGLPNVSSHPSKPRAVWNVFLYCKSRRPRVRDVPLMTLMTGFRGEKDTELTVHLAGSAKSPSVGPHTSSSLCLHFPRDGELTFLQNNLTGLKTVQTSYK